IVSESGIGAGTRRIEAVTSREAYELLSDEIDVLQHAAQQLKTSKDQVPKRIDDLHNEMNDLKKVNESLSTKLAQSATSTLVDNKKTIQDVDVLAQEVDVNNMKDLRSMMDEMRKKLTSGIILLAAEKDGKVLLVASVSQDLVSKGLHAGHLIKKSLKSAVVAVVDAQTWLKPVEKIQQKFKMLYSLLKRILKIKQITNSL